MTFPSGATLRVVSGPTGVGEEHYDPATTGNPLLDTSEPVRSKLLSASFSVGELSRSGGRNFDKARIDPELVRCLQRLRDRVGKPLRITSSYRPYAYNDKLYKETYKRKPTRSRHSSGQAADIRIAGMSGMEIAKAAIDALGTNIGVGIADTYAHVDVRGRWARWTYFGAGTEKDRLAIAEIGAYRRRRRRAGAPAPSLEQSPVDEGEEAPVEEGEEGPIGDGREPPWVGLADDELVEAPASDLAATDSPPPPLPDRLDRQVHELPEFKLAASPAASPMVFTLPERLSFLVQRLLDIKPTHRWNDKELERLIVTVSLPIDQALAYVGRMVGLDRRLAGLDLSFAHRAYDAAMERMVAGAEELHRYGIGIKTRHFAVVRTYFEGLKERRHRIEQALMALYSSDAALAASPTVNAPERGWGSSPPASLLQGTREINDEDRRRLTSILRPAPIPSIWGEPAATGKPDKPAKFQMRIPGVKEDFRTRVREHAELMIRELTKGYVTGKGAAERATVTPWARYQEIANAAKRSVDASFGAFAQRPAFVAGKNLKDRWEEVGKEQARFGAPERTGSAQGILSSMARSDSYLTRIKQQHHALPGRAPEQGILDTVLDDVAGRHIPELLAINRGWPGTQDSKTHSVNIQRWRVDNPGDAAHTAQRRDFWDVFQTIVHEYIHSLAEPRYEAFANKQPGDVTKILIEGVTSLLTEVAYSNVDPSNHLLRTQVEGQDLAGLPFDAKTVPDIRGQRYGQYNPALAMVGVVGLPNLYAAYFLGKTNLIKHAGAR